MPRTRRIAWIAIGVLWIGASCGGLLALAAYANSSGPDQSAPAQWPTGTGIGLSERGSTLIMFAHPRCPCTRASLGELEKVVARFQGSVTPWVVFFKPAGAGENWDQTDLRESAAAMPGVHVVSDPDGVEARRFNAMTSGQTVLYNDRGELLFSGGITLARGHAGDNTGRSAVESCLGDTVLGDTAPVCRQSPVFGCPIAVSSEQK
jgi:hypothetical protein